MSEDTINGTEEPKENVKFTGCQKKMNYDNFPQKWQCQEFQDGAVMNLNCFPENIL